jgi:D-glycero-D-manno-heptose 1,7-bisphosphate phosphatase
MHLLLDRDGVLNEDLPGSVLSVSDLQMIPAAIEAVRRIREAGVQISVCTNQACVGRGELSMHDLERINACIAAAVDGAISHWFICTHRQDESCDCRKPKPGLLLQAQAEFGLDLAKTWFVGDSQSDIDAALASGCRPALVLTGKGRNSRQSRPSVPAFDHLNAFADYFLGLRA